MAYDFIVYTRAAALPTAEQLSTVLEAAAPHLLLREPFPDPSMRSGALPVRVNAGETSVDVLYATIKEHEAAEFEADVAEAGEEMTAGTAQHLEILRTCDRRITLSGRSDVEREAAWLIASALAMESGGYLCDPQRDTTFRAGETDPKGAR